MICPIHVSFLHSENFAQAGFVNRWSGVQISHPAPVNQALSSSSRSDLEGSFGVSSRVTKPRNRPETVRRRVLAESAPGEYLAGLPNARGLWLAAHQGGARVIAPRHSRRRSMLLRKLNMKPRSPRRCRAKSYALSREIRCPCGKAGVATGTWRSSSISCTASASGR